MYPLFETIRIENGRVCHIKWHEERMIRSRSELWGKEEPVHLEEKIKIPENYRSGIVRCNLFYGKEFGPGQFQPYIKSSINKLRLVECNQLDYHLKYRDRSALEELLVKKGECDEIIIVKDGLITDTSFSNLIFFDGFQWVTPEKPLLKGTCRQRLIKEGEIREVEIHARDIMAFKGLKLINALRYPEEEEMIAISKIKWQD